MKSTSQCSLVDDKVKKWDVKSLLGPLAWLHRKFGPPLYSHLIILSRPTFLSLVITTTLFFSPPSFLFCKLWLSWKLCGLSAAPTTFSCGRDCSYMLDIPCSSKQNTEQRVGVCACLACWQTYVFYFAKVIQPRGKVLHNRPRKMYDTITSARQLALNLAAFLCGL